MLQNIFCDWRMTIVCSFHDIRTKWRKKTKSKSPELIRFVQKRQNMHSFIHTKHYTLSVHLSTKIGCGTWKKDDLAKPIQLKVDCNGSIISHKPNQHFVISSFSSIFLCSSSYNGIEEKKIVGKMFKLKLVLCTYHSERFVKARKKNQVNGSKKKNGKIHWKLIWDERWLIETNTDGN